jgi:methionine salvage enolase-phosphatase E1
MAKNFQKPEAIILDIEGTTTDKKFVSKTLFPILRKQMVNYLKENFNSIEVKEVVQRLKDLTNKDFKSK